MSDLTLTVEVSGHPANRLRIRPGDPIRITAHDGTVTEYRVTKVSMPDERGRCTVEAESTDA